MSAYKLAQQFEDRTVLPVRLNDVRKAVLAMGEVDRLVFKPVEINKDVLRGIHHKYWFSPAVYAPRELRVDILYAETLDHPWSRLVATKELIHTLDNGTHSTAKPEEVDDLIVRMARRPELREPMSWGETSDRYAFWQALGVLFPAAARDLILPKYSEGLISDEMIARRAGIPEQFVGFLMSEDWAEVYTHIMKMCEREQVKAA